MNFDIFNVRNVPKEFELCAWITYNNHFIEFLKTIFNLINYVTWSSSLENNDPSTTQSSIIHNSLYIT
jgi:hypothetical protein